MQTLVQQTQKRAECILVAAVGCSRDQHQMSRFVFSNTPKQIKTLLAPAPDTAGQGAAMGLIHDNELRTFEDEVLSSSGILDEVSGNNGETIAVKNRSTDIGRSSLQALDSTAQDQFGINMELLAQFPLPLLSQVRRAQYRHPPNFATVQKLAGDDRSLDGLADANVVGDQKAYRVQA